MNSAVSRTDYLLEAKEARMKNKRILLSIVAMIMLVLGCALWRIQVSFTSNRTFANAASYGDNSSLKEHLAGGRSANTPIFGTQSSALQLAVLSGDLESCKLLVNSSADVNHKGENGESPISLAVIADKPEIVKLLLNNSANPNILDDKGLTPLHIAVKSKNSRRSIRISIRSQCPGRICGYASC